MHKSLNTYEQILKRAWQTTKTHWELWFLGVFAGLAYSGGILQHVLQQLIRIRPADEFSLANIEYATPGATLIVTYGSALISLPSGRILLTILAIIFLVVACVLAAIAAQHALLEALHRASRRKKRIPLRKLLHEAEHVRFARLFAVNAIIFLVSNIIVIGTAIPLSLLLREMFVTDMLVYAGFYLLLLPLLFAINMFGMFALIHIVRLNDGIDKAVARAARTFKRHWLVAVEQACIVLGINLFALVCFAAAIVILCIAASPFFFIALSIGSAPLMATVGFVTFLTGAFGYITFFGMITTLNYAIWTELAEHLERFTLMPVFEGIIRKINR